MSDIDAPVPALVEEERLALAAQVPSLARHLPQILLPLDEMIERYCAAASLDPNAPAAIFLRGVAHDVGNDAYRRIQDAHLSVDTLKVLQTAGTGSVEQKYIDLPFWSISKYNTARRLGLHKAAFKRVLDIGAGPGHFGLVAKSMNCEFLGLDCDQFIWTPTARHLYDDLCECFDVPRVMTRIVARQPVEVPGRFDLLTCLMGTFTKQMSPGDDRPWGWGEWAWLLDQLIEDVMEPDRFTMFFQFSRQYLTPVAAELAPFCAEFNLDRGTFTIDQTIDRDGLKRAAA